MHAFHGLDSTQTHRRNRKPYPRFITEIDTNVGRNYYLRSLNDERINFYCTEKSQPISKNSSVCTYHVSNVKLEGPLLESSTTCKIDRGSHKIGSIELFQPLVTRPNPI